MSDKFFYIICRDGQILEIFNKPETYTAAFSAFTEKGVLDVMRSHGAVLNGSDISKILNDSQYHNYISTVNPKEYIRNGVWKDGKEKKIIRYEKWRQEEIEKEKSSSN